MELAPTIARDDIAGLIWAGGQGHRMSGVIKVLQLYRGDTLLNHALTRFSPQVRTVLH